MRNVTCVLFVDNLGFLISDSISRVGRLFGKIGKITLKWEASNSVTYDMSKTEAILFSKVRHQKLIRQLSETQLRFDGETFFFNKKATQWLGI